MRSAPFLYGYGYGITGLFVDRPAYFLTDTDYMAGGSHFNDTPFVWFIVEGRQNLYPAFPKFSLYDKGDFDIRPIDIGNLFYFSFECIDLAIHGETPR